jgi:tRNA 2-thiouridine synthesizing protein A
LDSQVELDTQGLLCPEPLMLLRNRVRALNDGDVIHILATDPSTHRDFANFCRFMGHKMLRADTDSEVLQFWIEKVGS